MRSRQFLPTEIMRACSRAHGEPDTMSDASQVQPYPTPSFTKMFAFAPSSHQKPIETLGHGRFEGGSGPAPPKSCFAKLFAQCSMCKAVLGKWKTQHASYEAHDNQVRVSCNHQLGTWPSGLPRCSRPRGPAILHASCSLSACSNRS